MAELLQGIDQHPIREVNASCCDRLQEGSLSNRCLLRVVADQQPHDDVGIKRPHVRLACPRPRRWPLPSAPGPGSD
jgi:hypothetical protein